MSRPNLSLVNTETGEVVEQFECAECQALKDQIAGLERDIRGWRARYAEMMRDREAEARMDELWGECEGVFNHWRRACRHPRSKFTLERFELIRPYLKRYGADRCRQAIDGAAFDPFTTRRKNGSVRRHDGLDLVFRSADKFEEFCNRAPRDAVANGTMGAN